MPTPRPVQGSSTDALPGVNPGHIKFPEVQPKIFENYGNNPQPTYEPRRKLVIGASYKNTIY